jgi:hypothetical protein
MGVAGSLTARPEPFNVETFFGSVTTAAGVIDRLRRTSRP